MARKLHLPNGSVSGISGGYAPSGETRDVAWEMDALEGNVDQMAGDIAAGSVTTAREALGGRSVLDKLGEVVSPEDFGAIGDGTTHPLSERYASLSAAQAVYPAATSLSQSIDWAAIQTAIDSVTGGGEVRLRRSAVYRADNLVIRRCVTLIGEVYGGQPFDWVPTNLPCIRSTAGATGWIIDTPAETTSRPRIIGISLFGDNAAGLGGVRLRDTPGAVVAGCLIQSLEEQAIRLIKGVKCQFIDNLALNCLLRRNRTEAAGVLQLDQNTTDCEVKGGEYNASVITGGIQSLLHQWTNNVAGTAQGGAGATITLAAATVATEGQLKDWLIEITSGAGAGQIRRITATSASTQVATVNMAWDTVPNATSVYIVYPVLCYAALIDGASHSIGQGILLEISDGGLYAPGKAIRLDGTVRCDINSGPGLVVEGQLLGDIVVHASSKAGDRKFDQALMIGESTSALTVRATRQSTGNQPRFGLNNQQIDSDTNKSNIRLAGPDSTAYSRGGGRGTAIDLPVGPAKAFGDGDTTPSVSSYRAFMTSNSGTTIITAFDDMVAGQEFTVLSTDVNTTIQHNGSTIVLSATASKTLRPGKVYRFVAASRVLARELSVLTGLTSITDSSGGAAGSAPYAVAAIPDPSDAPASADALRDDLVANVLPKLRDAIAKLAAQVELIRRA